MGWCKPAPESAFSARDCLDIPAAALISAYEDGGRDLQVRQSRGPLALQGVGHCTRRRSARSGIKCFPPVIKVDWCAAQDQREAERAVQHRRLAGGNGFPIRGDVVAQSEHEID